jgi:hypothetical protein
MSNEEEGFNIRFGDAEDWENVSLDALKLVPKLAQKKKKKLILSPTL